MIQLLSTLTKRAHRKHQQNQQPTNLHETNKKGAEIVMKTQPSDLRISVYIHIYLSIYLYIIYWSPKFPDISIQSQVFSMEKLRFFSTRREHEKNEAYLADAIAALFGSILGVSTVATFAESTAGVADGAKTGGFRRCGVPVDGAEKSWIFFWGVNSNCSKFQTPKNAQNCIPLEAWPPWSRVFASCWRFPLPR